ncbi:50S ribosomal protein L29 [Candidatus Bathyarchaeota archaeon]|nr:50S ribosomal protein L29 [Candidatus Bathyarchaeota archaeon]MBS7630752.1 50S ribosomal protein L29 [Candidatus Bathyarchaeota archaeon]
MPILRKKEIREMSQKEKMSKLDELNTELSKIRTMIHAGGAIENPGRAKALRKTIARLKTIMREEGVKI